MEPKYKVNPLTGELQEYVFEYNGIVALRNFTARVDGERLILHAADDVNFSILDALVSEVEINGVVYDNPTAAQEALTRLTFNQNRPVLLDKSLKDLILGAVQKIPGKKLSTEDFTTELRQKLEGLQQVDTSGLLQKGAYTGNASSLKADIDKKVDKVAGKGLSSNDYTNEEKRKNEENALKRVANITVTGDVNKIITITFADSTVMQAPFKDNDHIPLADVHMNSLNFNENTGVLTGVKSDGNEISVSLDGRYSLIGHNHDDRYAPKTHHHNEYAHRTHRHNWDDIDGKPNNLATTESVKTAIEGIQIGGRNLLRGTKDFVIDESGTPYFLVKNWNAQGWELVEEKFNGNAVRKVTGEWQGIRTNTPDILGEPVTISFWAKTNIWTKFGNWVTKQRNPDLDKTTVLSNNGILISDNQWHRYTIYNPNGMCLGEGLANGFIEFYQNTGEVFVSSIKIERGSVPTEWSPAPEDSEFEFYKRIISRTDLNTFKQRETGSYAVNNGGGFGTLLNFNSVGSTSSLEFYKENWYPNTRLGVRNSVDDNRFNDDGGSFRNLAWYDDILRAGVECTQNTTLQKEHQNQVIFVTVPCNIELNTIDDLSSTTFRKVFDNGTVTFTCTGKNIIYTTENQFNGKKGSTAVISRYGNDCYIDIRNV